MNAINKVIVAAAISSVAIIAYTVAAVSQAQPSTPAATPTTTTPATTTPAANTPVLATPVASTGSSPDLSGTYKCSGYDPYSKVNYTENVIFKKTGDTYSVQLIHSDSVVPYDLGTAVSKQETHPMLFPMCIGTPIPPQRMALKFLKLSQTVLWKGCGPRLTQR